MLIVENWNSTYKETINHFWNLEKDFSEDDGKNVLFAGWATVEHNNDYKRKYAHYENRMFFNTEQPCAFQIDARNVQLSANLDNYFNHVFTQDPYSAEWLNKLQNKDCFHLIFPCPYNQNDIVSDISEKEYDVLYWGGVHSNVHMDILDTIKNYNYNFLSIGPHAWTQKYNLPQYSNLITHTSMPRPEMWNLIRKTKINIMSNLLFLDPQTPAKIKRLQNWEDNLAFKNIDNLIMPQIKSRPFESAFNRCLMLVLRDPWNVQEYFFEPGKHFLYWDDPAQLKDMIDDIIINWKNYEEIVENAYQKAISSYTTEHFINHIKKACI